MSQGTVPHGHVAIWPVACFKYQARTAGAIDAFFTDQAVPLVLLPLFEAAGMADQNMLAKRPDLRVLSQLQFFNQSLLFMFAW